MDSAKRGRGRPKDEAGTAQRRHELVAAAFRVFASKGYSQATVGDIATELGIGHGTFYRYYSSKRDILNDAVEYGFREVFGDAAPLELSSRDVDSVPALLDWWTSGIERVCTTLEANPGVGQVLLFESSGTDEEILHRILDLLESRVAVIREVVQQARTQGLIDPGLNPDVLSRAAVMLGFPPILAAIAGRKFDRPEYFAGANTMLLRGLGASPA